MGGPSAAPANPAAVSFRPLHRTLSGASRARKDFDGDATFRTVRIDLSVEPPDAALSDPVSIGLYLKHVFLPWRRMKGRMVVACADPDARAREAIAQLYGARTVIVTADKAALLDAAQRLFRAPLIEDATYRLDVRAPQFSARRAATSTQRGVGVAVLCIMFAAIAALPQGGAFLLALLAMCYFASIGFRLILFCAAASPGRLGLRVAPAQVAALNEGTLPVYSILVPLYREANVLTRLVRALKALDYPPEKLDIKLILEEDDHETCDAARALNLDPCFEILHVPPSFPRTKPKATNFGLAFARGEFVVIYDAEDSPESDQLKKAVAAFAALPKTVACLQARLNFYNRDDNWLTRMFAIEYAAWFDYLLPGLARLGMPIPLGGTSNHFRADTLRALHGWDAFNVTEDADLGIRMARQGYRVLPLDSSTYEEAVGSLDGWLGQRSRWLKGYMQTVLVHSRWPREFLRAVGLARFLGFFLFLGGAVLTNVLSPLFWLGSLIWAAEYASDPSLAVQAAFFCLLLGNAVLTVLAMLAPLKRGWMNLVPYGASVFLYGLLVSAASYRALWQFVAHPFYWEKTEHGLTPPVRAGGIRRMPSLRFRWLAPACLFAVLVAGIGYANPWLKARSTGEAIVNVMVAANPAGFAPAGRSANAASDIHFEYGATDNVTLVFDSDATYDRPAEGTAFVKTRFDTAWLGPRVALARWTDSVLSIEAEAGLAGLYDTAWSSPTLSLNGAAQGRLLLGRGFTLLHRHGFASLEAGWRWRGGAAADEAVLDMTLGIAPWRGGLLMLQSFSALSTGDAREPYRRFDTHKVQVSLAQDVSDRLSVQAGLIETVIGTDAGTGGGMLALWWRF